MGRFLSKRACCLLVALLLLAGFISAAAVAAESPQFTNTAWTQGDTAENRDGTAETDRTGFSNTTQVQKDATGNHESDVLIPGDRKVCENQHYEMYYNEETSVLKVRHLDNGYIWASGRVNDNTAQMTASWERFAHCLVSAEFVDTGTMTTSSGMPNFKAQRTVYLENGIEVTVPFSKVDCSVMVRILLEEDGLFISVPDETIVMNEERKLLSKLYVLPFFGASMAGEGDGYLLIPDGCGALIRFGAARTGTGSYTGRIYGDDLSIRAVGSSALVSGMTMPAESVRLPVFGIVHGYQQNSVLCEITGGAEYCEIVANPAGNMIDWYWAAPRFIYNERYFQQDNTGSGFILSQPEANEVNASFRIRFFSGDEANYVSMGNSYRDTLIERGWLSETVRTDDSVPLMLDCLMAESEDTGLWTSNVVLTELSDLKKWDEVLRKAGIDQVIYSLRGAAKNGYSRSDASDFGLWHRIGSEAEAKDLIDQGMCLVYNKDMITLFPNQMNRNYYSYAINRSFAERDYQGYLDEKVYFASLRGIQKIAAQAEENSLEGISVDALGTLLMGNFKSGSSYSRGYAMEEITRILAQIQESQDYVLLQNPNAYALPYADAAYDLPLNNSRYLFETDCVPFLQIVLSGCMDQFTQSNYVVRSENRADILRLIDYNVCPRFTVTAADETKLAKTNSNMLFCSEFDMLSDEIKEIYKMVDDALSPVQGASVIQRAVPEDDFVITSYSNGWSILINYSDSAKTENGIAVPEYSAVTVLTEQLSADRRD